MQNREYRFCEPLERVPCLSRQRKGEHVARGDLPVLSYVIPDANVQARVGILNQPLPAHFAGYERKDDDEEEKYVGIRRQQPAHYFRTCATVSKRACARNMADKASAGSVSTCGSASCSCARLNESSARFTSISSAFSTMSPSTRTLSGNTSTKPPCTAKYDLCPPAI